MSKRSLSPDPRNLEAEAIYIFREVAAEFRKPVLLKVAASVSSKLPLFAHSQPQQQKATIQFQQASLWAPVMRRECLQQVEGRQGASQSDKADCMREIISPLSASPPPLYG